MVAARPRLLHAADWQAQHEVDPATTQLQPPTIGAEISLPIGWETDAGPSDREAACDANPSAALLWSVIWRAGETGPARARRLRMPSSARGATAHAVRTN